MRHESFTRRKLYPVNAERKVRENKKVKAHGLSTFYKLQLIIACETHDVHRSL